MKVLVVSDTHGRLENLQEVLKKDGPFGMILHCGDVCHDEDEIRELAGPACTVCYVRGNCDYFSHEPDTRDFELGSYKVHMEHGHNLPSNMNALLYKAEELGADIVLSGHTHKPMYTEAGRVRIINPGSISKPRQADGCPTYVIINVDENGEISVSQKKLAI